MCAFEVSGLWRAGFYPNILRVDAPPAVFKRVLGGAMEHDASPIRIKFFDRVKGARNPLHSLFTQHPLTIYLMLLMTRFCPRQRLSPVQRKCCIRRASATTAAAGPINK